MDEKEGVVRVRKPTKRQIIDALTQCTKTIECGGCIFEDRAACKTFLMRQVLGIINDLEMKISDHNRHQCKECSYRRDDGWCNEHRRETKGTDYCSFGKWKD